MAADSEAPSSSSPPGVSVQDFNSTAFKEEWADASEDTQEEITVVHQFWQVSEYKFEDFLL